MAIGSWPSYSLDMVKWFFMADDQVILGDLVVCSKADKLEIGGAVETLVMSFAS